jgi:hypothetical protein
MPGDLGKLGSGSLNYKTINFLLECLIQNTTLRSSTMGEMRSDLHKIQLELAVRLLACAQRKYLARHEWNEMIDPTQAFISEIKDRPDPRRYGSEPRSDIQYDVCAPEALSESPFVYHVLRHICVHAPGWQLSIADLGDEPGSKSHMGAGERWVKALSLALNELCVNAKTLIALLQLLSSAAELFPLGSCWTSSSQNRWTTLSDDKEQPVDSDAPIRVLGSSSADLHIVVQVVCTVLEEVGGFNSSADCQYWVLTCLARLAVATHAHNAIFADDVATLRSVWMRVWATLFRPDLCYSSRTTASTSGTNGGLVLQLLLQMVRFFPSTVSTHQPTQETFLCDRQSDVWNLPAFSHVDIGSPSVFMLMYALLDRIVLCDGSDTVGQTEYENEVWKLRVQKCGWWKAM